MIMDKLLRFCEAAAVTSSAALTDVIDLGVAQDINPGRDLEVFALVTESFTASGSATLQLSLQGSTDNSTFTDMAQTAAIGKASLVAGVEVMRISVPGPIAGQSNPRYLRLYATVATGPMTAGKITAGLVLDRQRNNAYAPGISISN